LALEQLRSLLRRHRRIALDSSIFIYQLDANPRYLPLAGAVFLALEAAAHTAVTSTVTWTELLVPAYRSSEQKRISQYIGLFSTFPHLEWIAPDLVIADLAARLRASHDLKTPDALQAATAIQSGATLFITNDRVFRRIPNFHSLILNDQL
jgi:predicted nucleic acid-binding protein